MHTSEDLRAGFNEVCKVCAMKCLLDIQKIKSPPAVKIKAPLRHIDQTEKLDADN